MYIIVNNMQYLQRRIINIWETPAPGLTVTHRNLRHAERPTGFNNPEHVCMQHCLAQQHFYFQRALQHPPELWKPEMTYLPSLAKSTKLPTFIFPTACRGLLRLPKGKMTTTPTTLCSTSVHTTGASSQLLGGTAWSARCATRSLSSATASHTHISPSTPPIHASIHNSAPKKSAWT